MLRTILAIAILFLAATGAGAAEYGITFWSQDMTGLLAASRYGLTGSGSVREAGRSSTGYFLRLERFEFAYAPLYASNTVDGTFEFAGQTFTAQSSLTADLDVFEAFFRMKLFRILGSGAHLLLGAKLVQGRFELSGGGVSVPEVIDELVVVPQAGLSGTLNLANQLRLVYTVKHLQASVSGISARVTDTVYGLSWKLSAGLHLDAGYRSLLYRAAYDQDTAEPAFVDIRHQGFFLGATYRF